MAVADPQAAVTLPRLELDWAAPGALDSPAGPLGAAYGGSPRFPSSRPDRPAVIANFVSTLDGVVVLGVASAVDERYRLLAGSSAERLKLVLLCRELVDVSLSELGEAGGVMAEPAAQRRAGGELVRPLVEMGALPFHSSRPEAVDQDAVAVRG